MEPGRIRRIAIVGSPGAGKSTLARRLGSALGLPVIHLDALFWKPGWVETPRDEFIGQQRRALMAEGWIVDGNYGATIDLRLAAADTILFLDAPRLVCLWGVVSRAARHAGRTRSDMGPGCPERIDLAFLRYVWRFRRDKRPALLCKLRALEGEKRVVRLSSRAEVAAFLRQASADAPLPPAPAHVGQPRL